MHISVLIPDLEETLIKARGTYGAVSRDDCFASISLEIKKEKTIADRISIPYHLNDVSLSSIYVVSRVLIPQISHLYSPIRVLTAPIVTQVNPIVNCSSRYTGRVNNNPCPSLIVTMEHGIFVIT